MKHVESETGSVDVAAWLISMANNAEHDISVLPLQKMVTLTQSMYGFTHGAQMYQEPVYAFQYGPVTKPVLNLYGGSRDSISEPKTQVRQLPDAQLDAIARVWSLCAPLTSGQLVQLTHEVGPWKQYRDENNNFSVIPWQEFSDAWPQYQQRIENYVEQNSGRHDETSGTYRLPADMIGKFGDSIAQAERFAQTYLNKQ